MHIFDLEQHAQYRQDAVNRELAHHVWLDEVRRTSSPPLPHRSALREQAARVVHLARSLPRAVATLA